MACLFLPVVASSICGSFLTSPDSFPKTGLDVPPVLGSVGGRQCPASSRRPLDLFFLPPRQKISPFLSHCRWWEVATVLPLSVLHSLSLSLFWCGCGFIPHSTKSIVLLMGVGPTTSLLGSEKNQLSFFVLFCVLSLSWHLPIRGYTRGVGKLYRPWRQVAFTNQVFRYNLVCLFFSFQCAN